MLAWTLQHSCFILVVTSGWSGLACTKWRWALYFRAESLVLMHFCIFGWMGPKESAAGARIFGTDTPSPPICATVLVDSNLHVVSASQKVRPMLEEVGMLPSVPA